VGNVVERRLEKALARHAVQIVRPLATTAAAELHEVRRDDRRAVLKLWPQGHAGNEAAGVRLMQAWAGPHMVAILGAGPDSVLMEALDGPSLGDLSRQGRDAEACRLLADTARALHAGRPQLADLPTVGVWFERLFALPLGTCPASVRRDMTRAQALARDLIATTAQPVPLHGDLHHDNVILTATGPKAFDAKGLTGDPAFELANAIRNPKGIPATVRDPGRIAACLDTYADALDVSRHRLAGWAAAKCAHSIAMRGQPDTDPEADLLSALLAET
jgi:streptomycin 6-kinase